MQAPSLRTFAASLAVLCLVATPGCLFGSRSRTTYRGQYISQQTFTRLQAGASEEDVFDLFGEPTTKSVNGDKETWRYHYTQATTKAGSVLFLFATSSETEHEGKVTVEFADAVVTRITRN